MPVLGMPLVRVRIVLGESLLGEPTRPFAPTATVQAVVDQACPIAHGISAACLVVLDDAKASPTSREWHRKARKQPARWGYDGHVIDGFVGSCMHATDA